MNPGQTGWTVARTGGSADREWMEAPERSFVVQDYPSATHRPYFDIGRAAGPQHPGAFPDGAAGSHHVIDQRDPDAGQRVADGEGSKRIKLAAAGVQLGLPGGVAHPLQAIGQQRPLQRAGRRPGQFQRLVKAAFAQPERMQRHRDDAIRQRGVAFSQRGGEQRAEQSGVAQPACELEAANQEVQRRFIAERGKDAIKIAGL